MEAERVQVVQRVRVLCTRRAVPPHGWQASVPQELEHDDAARVLHRSHVSHRVAEEERGWRLCHVARKKDEDRDHDGQEELQAVLPCVVLQVLDVGPDSLLAEQRSESATAEGREGRGSERTGGHTPATHGSGADRDRKHSHHSRSTAIMKCAIEWKPSLHTSTCLYMAGCFRFRSRSRSTVCPSPSRMSTSGTNPSHCTTHCTIRSMSLYDLVSHHGSGRSHVR